VAPILFQPSEPQRGNPSLTQEGFVDALLRDLRG
jgi:hypothetical protein